MGGDSRVAVEERLSALEQRYGSFPVNQTTLTVPAAERERAPSDPEGGVEVIAVVRNGDDELLLGEGESGWVIPRGMVGPEERLEGTVRRVVREAAGVDCVVDRPLRASIVGLRDADGGTTFRLRVAFAARGVGAVEDTARRWSDRPGPVRSPR